MVSVLYKCFCFYVFASNFHWVRIWAQGTHYRVDKSHCKKHHEASGIHSAFYTTTVLGGQQSRKMLSQLNSWVIIFTARLIFVAFRYLHWSQIFGIAVIFLAIFLYEAFVLCYDFGADIESLAMFLYVRNLYWESKHTSRHNAVLYFKVHSAHKLVNHNVGVVRFRVFRVAIFPFHFEARKSGNVPSLNCSKRFTEDKRSKVSYVRHRSFQAMTT